MTQGARARTGFTRRLKFPRSLKIGAATAALVVAAGSAATVAAAAVAQDLDSIADQVARLLADAANAAYPDGRVSVDVQPVDPRVRLAACEDVEAQPRGQQVHGRVAVAVRCSAPQAWSIFMTADVRVEVPVVVARSPVRRGERLAAGQLETSYQDLSRLRSGFYREAADVAGLEATRNLSAGTVLVPAQLKEPLAVLRGDRVHLSARRGAALIATQGEALDNGSVGDQIRVRNLTSERIVHAWISAPGRVSTSPLPADAGPARAPDKFENWAKVTLSGADNEQR
ncbi:MAG: flagellar basal body P-ring formation chaperone FlgA [Pseudomonadales bacterium]